MNKSAIQKFAIWARTEMIAQVEQRAYQYGITKDGYGEENAVTVMGRALTPVEQEQRWELILQIKHKGYTQVMEEVAYTWFNRFIALRFMEVNNYLPTHIRVFSDSTGAFKPEILSSAMMVELDGMDRAKVAQMIDANQTEDLYRYLLLTQCNALNEALPKMFEKMGGYTELLLPNNILRTDGILGRMVNEIPEVDWSDQVQIIGWLYQYYNAELKDETFALLKKNVKITKERIPSATQLFTPDWIVRYMVENSLGRLWIEGHPNEELKSGWKYYLDEAEQESDVQARLKKIQAEYRNLKPQDIKVIDPCMGSGHILVYAFDVLVQIYKSYGISERDAAKLILENNLYGLDIDDRAAQLAYFAVMMKARQHDRRIFSRGVQPNVFSIQESNTVNRHHLKFFGWQMSHLERNLALNQVNALLDEFVDAKEYGSILNISKQDWGLLYRFVGSVDYSDQMTLEAMGLEETKDRIFELVKIAATMAQKYDVVVTNPPYMGGGGMSTKLIEFVKNNYPDAKSDLFACCIEKGNQMTVLNGYNCMVTMQSWMFLSSFEKMREKLLASNTITNLMHMENMVMGIAFGTAVTCFRNSTLPEYKGTYNHISLKDVTDGEPDVFPVPGNRLAQISVERFSAIPGVPIAYWVSDNFVKAYSYPQLSDYGFARSGLQTGNNELYLRLWHELDINRIAFGMKNKEEYVQTGRKWTPQIKGGSYRKWYGNFDYVVNWENDGDEIRKCNGCRLNALANDELFFKEGATWSHTTSGGFGARYLPEGHLFNVEAPTYFADQRILKYALGMLNSKIAQHYLNAINSTVHYLVGNISTLPLLVNDCYDERIREVVDDCITISKKDWDAFETSWDFLVHPLVLTAYVPDLNGGHLASLSDCYAKWEALCEKRFNQLKVNEKELNRIFIDIYGLQDELTPDVEAKDVTVRRADLSRDIRSLISYAVGCMLGRYSLDEPGVVYAGGEWDMSKYITFVPNKDNIIPICDDDYFDDDIVARFIKWVETVYGEGTLEENLKFIAGALGGKGTPRQVIRNYFLNDFYADHCNTYAVAGSGKRPIYWLFDSGKKNGFKALIYMHRYQSDLLARMRTDYVHEMQERYRTQLTHLNDSIAHASTSERVKLNKQLKKIQDQALELQKYEEKIHHLADRNISIDLDDGVKNNYALFGDVLAKIK